tara:strand:+ start:538 stop:1626 length:1089 start_codon:yes stop_codon:yes gene_type:complete
MSKKKICFIIPALSSGGAERVLSNLANFLTEDYDVHIITLSYNEAFYKLDPRISLHHCTLYIKPSTSTLAALRSNWSLLKTIIKISRENKFQLLIGFMTTANILSIISSKFLGISVIISERNNPSMENTPKIWKILRRSLYKLANFLVVQTEPIKQFYLKTVNKNKIVIVPNPITMNISSKQLPHKEDNIILNVGRLCPQKAQDILIRAFALTQNNGWKLIIAGEGEDRSKLEKLINELKLIDKVKLAGRVKEIAQIYTQAKIFAFSSVYEGFPNALIEAMYFGIPCISTDCPTGPAELIVDGENGFLTPINHVEEFAGKLEILMTNKDLREKFADKSAEAVSQFDIKNVAEKWKLLIEKCI